MSWIESSQYDTATSIVRNVNQAFTDGGANLMDVASCCIAFQLCVVAH